MVENKVQHIKKNKAAQELGKRGGIARAISHTKKELSAMASEAAKIRWTDGITAHNCRTRLNKAIRKGKIKRLPCEKCGSLPSEAHHIDYKKALDVVWLCRKHHIDRHTILRRMEAQNDREQEMQKSILG